MLDSGASDVNVPADVVLTLFRTKTLSEQDFIGQQLYRLADGSSVPSNTFRIRSLKVGNLQLKNVVGNVGDVSGIPLLGQSFLSRLGRWSVDNQRHVLMLEGEATANNGVQ
jgi:predicted aspartyl protease